MKHPLRLLVIAAVLVALTSFAASARAGLPLGGVSCGPTSAVFSQWGDNHQYYFTSNGGFESGSSGWTLGPGASVTEGNEPFFIHSSSDNHALSLANGAFAASPWVCFGSNTPHIRFMASGSGSIHVRLIARGLLGELAILDGGTIQVGPSWAPTPDLGTTFSQLNSALLGANAIQVVLTATGNVQVDDLYIDPFTQY
ncbi:MAG: hypothetical protein JO186_10370 [Actinobacteria bacterium]|nr:hypothetical protein [Actinomycetota bacterium]MBV8394965.1 hypothetical protein [Actinomycetota bacterium]MBV8599140.1 hypothetical protein [Actinomycetota bacterium]